MPQSTPTPPDENSFAEATPPSEANAPALPHATPTPPEEDLFATTRAWLMELVAEAEKIDHDLPEDMAENHGYYAHGSPRK